MADEAQSKKKGVWQTLLEGFKPMEARANASEEAKKRAEFRRKHGSTSYLKGYEYNK